jgi:hypothetical protein
MSATATGRYATFGEWKMPELGWKQDDNGNVTVTMTYDDWQNLVLAMGYAGGHILKNDERKHHYRHLALMNRLNVGNPHFRPYEIPEEAES